MDNESATVKIKAANMEDDLTMIVNEARAGFSCGFRSSGPAQSGRLSCTSDGLRPRQNGQTAFLEMINVIMESSTGL